MDMMQILTEEFSVRREQVQNVVELLDDGKTVPFIARYRKELTGALDDQTIRRIAQRLQVLRNLETRKEEIRTAIENKNAMTEEIMQAIDKAMTQVELEDIYRPFKEKRRTRGSVAREKGLQPLAELLLGQNPELSPEEEAKAYLSEEKEIPDTETALQGAMDIIAEIISDNAEIRLKMRDVFQRFGTMVCTRAAKTEEIDPEKVDIYQDYFEYEKAVLRLQGHQILAIHRGCLYKSDSGICFQSETAADAAASEKYHHARF